MYVTYEKERREMKKENQIKRVNHAHPFTSGMNKTSRHNKKVLRHFVSGCRV